jgi:hypothetical protein
MKLRRGRLYELTRSRVCIIEKSGKPTSYPKEGILMYLKSKLIKGKNNINGKGVSKTWHHYFLNDEGDIVIFYQAWFEFSFSSEKWANVFLREAV